MKLLPERSTLLTLLTLCLGMAACGQAPEESRKGLAPTLVSTATAQSVRLELREEAVGTLEGLIDPTVAAEVAARVVKVLVHPGQAVSKGQPIVVLDATDFSLQQREAQSEVARIETLLTNQGRIVERNERLVQKNFISKNAVEDATTQQAALREQLDGARSRLASIQHTGAKTHIVAPVNGIVEKQIVSPGDFVKIGDPLLQIISKQRLRAHLPFPETVAARLTAGLSVRLSTPTSPDSVTATIREFKPLIGAGNHAVDVIAEVVDQPGWQPGASVNGSIVTAVHDNAVVVPEQSVVLRPAGEVVYIIANNKAAQRIVKTGLRQDGRIEIVQGLAAGEQVAVDGAAFLTDQATVSTQPAPPAKP